MLISVDSIFAAKFFTKIRVFSRRYRLDVAGKSLPVLTNLDKGKFGVIVFENFNKYLHMDKWNRELLDKYCLEYGVGVVGFLPPTEQKTVEPLKGFPLFVRTRLKLKVRRRLLLLLLHGRINYWESREL